MMLLLAVLLAVCAPKAFGESPKPNVPGPCQRLGGAAVKDCSMCSSGTCIKDANSTSPGLCCLTTLVDKTACLRLNGTTSCSGCDSTCVSLKDKSFCCLTGQGSTKCSIEKMVRMNPKQCSELLKPLTNNSTSIAAGCRTISDVLGCLAKAFVNTTDVNAMDTCIEELTAELKGDPNASGIFLNFLTTNNLTIGIPNFSYALCQGIGSNATCTTTDLINALSAEPLTCRQTFSPLLNRSNSIAAGCSALREGIECLTNASLKRTASSTSPMKCQADVYAELRQSKSNNDFLDFMKRLGVQIAIQDFHFQACQENWNTFCAPAVILPTSECMSDCEVATPCSSAHECCSQKCSNGKEARKCAPDMRQCVEVNAISQYAVQCLNFFVNVIAEGITFDAYCSNLWGGLKCVAEKMMGTKPRYSTECVTRMALYLRLSPTAITDRLKQLLPTENIKQEYALNSTRCSENPLMTDTIPSRPGTSNKSACANPDTVVGYVTSGACKPPANTNVTEKNCQAFGAMLECIAKALVRDSGISDDGGLHRGLCVDTMTQMMSDSHSTLKRLFGGNTGAFDPKECVVHATVCGMGNGRPLEGRTCSAREACPSGYKCVDKYCCSEEKSGICPDYAGKRPPCNARCQKDSDCGSQEKCCNVGCNGGSTCVPLVSHNFSKCEREFDNAKQLLIVSGECGDGNSVLRIPKCENSRFAPMQGDIEKSRFYCVDEHGDKIAGSDHSDVVDCTKVNAGKCPAKPAVCANKTSPDIYQCNDDSKCAAYQKCCMTELSKVCITGCVNVTQADAAVQEDCPNPVCCPITLCQDQVCAADVTATCRIQSCGQCSVKFYNKNGHVKDCEAGVPKCKVQRIAARIANAKMKKTAGQKLGAFINSRLRKSNGSSAAMVDVMHTEGDVMETEDDLLDRLPDDPEMGMQHNERSVPKVDHFCNLLNKFAPCQRGNCSLGDPSRSVWQLCTCEPGYYGLLCEKNDTDQSKYLSRSPCERDRHSIDSIRSLLRNATTSRLSALVAMYIKMRSADIRFLPEITCGSGLEFNATQRALLLPDRGVHISYCSNRTTGKPVPNTLVFAAVSAGTLTRPDCNIIVQQDPLSLPQRCLFSKGQNCTSLNCGYFYDLTSQRCMKGAPTVHSFDSLTDCYETCSFSYKCNITNTPDYCTISSSPKPCQDTTGKSVCDYRKQFCHVSENSDMNMTQMGSCKDFPAFCLLNKSAGYHVMGVAKEPAYFYNATSRRCERFLYLGMGGNNNRFSSLHQCHTECGARAYKYDDVSCPLPTLLMESYPEIQEDVCDNDYGCPDGQVCCSNGMFHVCASPVKTCVGGGRCSLDGICDRGNCTCPECDTDAPLPVCGSDGTTYHSLCALHRRACQTMANITVAYYGACHREMCNGMQCKEYESCSNNTCACSNLCTMEYEPLCAVVPGRNIKRQFGNKCHLMSVACQTHTRYVVIRNGTCDFKTPVTCEAMCTSEYDPVCVLYPGTSGTPVTLPNMCHVDKCAENEASTRPHVLYSGECQGRCGANLTCQMYQQCVNGTCGCNSVCTKELRPVCAYAVNVPEQLKTFSNECEMRREGCLTATRYIIVEFGPCVKPAPKSDCPATRPDVPNSYSFSCRVETDAFCDRETEKCCPYGAGTRCVPRSSLIVRKEVKFGFCPRITPLTYDLSECHSDICGQDGDCAGMGKCCVNVVCGHSTCAVPEMPHAYENPQTTVCGADFTEIPDVECDPSVNASSCPVGSSCKRARIGEEAIGVCCSKMATDLANNPEIRARQTLCRLMEVVGIGCPGGRKCLGDLRGGRVCGVEDQGNCSIGIVQCVVNPCNVSTCSNYPTAKCTANYCGGCHAVYTMEGKDVTHLCNATLCQNERDFYEKLNNAGLMKTTTALQEINMFADHMRLALRMQGVHNIPSNGTIVCDSAGNYRPYQHYMNAKGEVHKLCVNTKTGVPYGRPDPEQPCDEHDNASRPELCSEKPDLVGTCDDSETERYYFNPDSASCEMYIDRGCNVMTPNSFNDLVACTSVCGGYGRSSPCAVMKCATGTHCVVNSGSAMCKALGENNGSGHLEPVCDKEGKFMKRQCYQGVCACVDPDTGSVTNATDCNKELPVGQATNNVDFSSCGPGISTKRIYCPNDGDGCNGCRIQTMSHPMEQCSKCQTCPTQSPPACGAQCNVTSVCKERPYALCRINKCDCTAEFVENGKVVTNCEKAQSKCEMKKMSLDQQAKQGSLKGEKAPEVQYRCSKTGSFEVICQAGSCHCLNATSGDPVGSAIRGALESVDCTETQMKTKPKSVKVRLTVAKDKKLADFSAQARQEIIDKIKREMEKKAPGSNVTVVLRDGSILADVTVESTGQSDVEGVDINSAAESFIAEANINGIELTVGGETFSTETGTASLTEIVVENPVTERPSERDDNDDKNRRNRIIIIVVVVVGGSALIAIGIGIYCYKKANKSKNMQPFSDIQGKNNPVYNNEVQN